MKKFGNILWGLIFIIVGLIFGLNALGITNINIFFDGWWTLFIIVPCFIGMFKDNEKTGNLIGLLVGIVLLLCAQDILAFDIIFKLLLPTILVLIGLSFIFKNTIGGKVKKEIKKLNENKNNDNEHCATFSSQKVKFEEEEFTGADLTAVFGGIDCDLSKSIISSDKIINSTAIFGGINIFVPDNIKVKIKSTSIFGGVTNKKTDSAKEDSHIIYVNATCIFGGVEIK
ncbi:MAG: LiaF-related protein [Clostridia bacterium]|nr:LiaF-related protein [Clostridia bacterium]